MDLMRRHLAVRFVNYRYGPLHATTSFRVDTGALDFPNTGSHTGHGERSCP